MYDVSQACLKTTVNFLLQSFSKFMKSQVSWYFTVVSCIYHTSDVLRVCDLTYHAFIILQLFEQFGMLCDVESYDVFDLKASYSYTRIANSCH